MYITLRHTSIRSSAFLVYSFVSCLSRMSFLNKTLEQRPPGTDEINHLKSHRKLVIEGQWIRGRLNSKENGNREGQSNSQNQDNSDMCELLEELFLLSQMGWNWKILKSLFYKEKFDSCTEWKLVIKWGNRSEVKVAQSCLTLCNPLGYTVHGIL